MNWDAFISYSKKDKSDVVEPLVRALEKESVRCWLDRSEIELGDDVALNVNMGLKQSRIGIVIVSKAFVGSVWPERELSALFSKDTSVDKQRIVPILVGDDREIKLLLQEYPLFTRNRYWKWSDGKDGIVLAILAILSRSESGGISDLTQRPRQIAVRKRFTAIVFAGGKSQRFGTFGQKVLFPVVHLGSEKPMIIHTVDLFSKLQIPMIIITGFQGKKVRETIEDYNRYSHSIKFIQQGDDEGEHLAQNTGGTLKEIYKEILEKTPAEYLLFTVGDQPYMEALTINEFILDIVEKGRYSGILVADATGTPLEESTSTRVSIAGDTLTLRTPPKDAEFDKYSNLLDVGVLVMHRSIFEHSVSKISSSDVFSKMLQNLPVEKERFLSKTDHNPWQFRNINRPEDTVSLTDDLRSLRAQRELGTDTSSMLLDWLRWNVDNRREEGFNIFDYSKTIKLTCEIDTTTICKHRLSCTPYCTYKAKHTDDVVLDTSVGKYVLDKAKKLGFQGVLFSGGGENLEPAAYQNFLKLLTYAKEELGLETNLATNGLYLTERYIRDIAWKLDSIRFSISPSENVSSSKVLVAPPIHKFCHYVKSFKNTSEDYSPTKVYANFLISPGTKREDIELLVRMYSQLGLDGIRLKLRHERQDDGEIVVRAAESRHHQETISALINDSNLTRPNIIVSKLPDLLRLIENPQSEPGSCWYRDFNPLILGADGRLYACCEFKYDEEPFLLGKVSHTEDNLVELIQLRQSPQPIVPKMCFKGCKGYLINSDLTFLLEQYNEKREKVFDYSENVAVRDRLMRNLPRTVLSN